MSTIPVVLINGFLGSGKTTLLKHLLRSPEFAHSFLIENEYANINIDREAIADEHDHEIYEISGSCICCSTGEELEAALSAIVEKGWTKPVIIEATGMANSAILMRRLFLNAEFTQNFHILNTVLIIDAAEAVAEQLDQALTLEIMLSDLVLINKSDLAPESAKKLSDTVKELNPESIVISTVRAVIDPKLVAQGESKAEIAFANTFSQLADLSIKNLNYAVVDLDRPFDPEHIRAALTDKKFFPEVRLQRAKGFFVDHNGIYWQVEATAKHIELNKVNKPKKQVLIAIGEGMTKKALQEALV